MNANIRDVLEAAERNRAMQYQTLRWPFWVKLWMALVLAYVAGAMAVDALVVSCWWPIATDMCGVDFMPPPDFAPMEDSY